MDVNVQKNLSHVDCIFKYVKIKSVDKRVHEGWLKTIDPLTGNLILVTLKEKNSKVKNLIVLFSGNVCSIDVMKEEDPTVKAIIQNMHAADTYLLTESALDRKIRLKDWIKTNRLPLEDAQNGRDLIVCESVTIHPPYTVESCSSTNGRVLMMIRNLVGKLPSEEKVVTGQKESNQSSDEDDKSTTVDTDT